MTNITDSVSSSIQNPIAGKLNKILSKINIATANIESKIDKLIENIAVSSNNKSKVELINNTIVITVRPEDAALLTIQKAKIQSNINSITGTLNVLKTSIGTLSTINDTVKILKKVLDVQEALMSVNPVTKASFEVFKKAIKIVFLKDMLVQYSKVVDAQLSSNKKVLNDLISKFDKLRIDVKVSDETNNGNVISTEQAQELITDELLLNVGDSSITEDFYNDNGVLYLLKIEKIDHRHLIGRAYLKETNQLAQQTAPSMFSTAQNLLDELKSILNIS